MAKRLLIQFISLEMLFVSASLCVADIGETAAERISSAERPTDSSAGIARSSGSAVVEFRKEAGKWLMLVDGKPFIIKGIEYSVDKIGLTPENNNEWMSLDINENGINDAAYESWVDKNYDDFQDLDEPVIGDFALLKEMGCNTIRIYHPFNINKKLLRDLYANYGIRVIMGNYLGAYTIDSKAEWEKGTDYTDHAQRDLMKESVRKMVAEYKDEPFILMWMLGNENDVSGNAANSTFNNTNASKERDAYAIFVGQVCKMIKEIDKNHPVGVCNGGYAMLPYYQKYADSIDVIAFNAYKGVYGFGSLWNRAKGTFDRPVLITEYGTDSYDMRTNTENNDFQSVYHEKSWMNIMDNSYYGEKSGNAIGGVVYCWLDKWWLCGDAKYHDTAKGSWLGPTIDNAFNDEWLGVCGQGKGRRSPFVRQLKKAYYIYKEKLWNRPIEDVVKKDTLEDFSLDVLRTAAKSSNRYSMYSESGNRAGKSPAAGDDKPFNDLLSGKITEQRGSGRVCVVKRTTNWQLLVDGKPYIVKGMDYSPHPVGYVPSQFNEWMYYDSNGNGRTDSPYEAWIDENSDNYQDVREPSIGDFQMLQDMGCNTIRLYDASNIRSELLSELYEKYGIMSIMGNMVGDYSVDQNGRWVNATDYTDPEQRKRLLENVKNMVTRYKNEEYVLMWMLGNENDAYGNAVKSKANISTEKNKRAFYQFVGEVVRMIKKYDSEHPVGVCSAYYKSMANYAIYAPEIDIVGINAYTGSYGFGSLWNRIKYSFDRPVLITEYGIDCYDSKKDEVNEAYQAMYHKKAWQDIIANSYLGNMSANSIGGVVFSWLDKWWACGFPKIHDTKANIRKVHVTDGYYTDEWFGICSQGDGTKSPFLRQLRKVYLIYKNELWANEG